MVFSQNIYFTLIIFLNKNATEYDVGEVILYVYSQSIILIFTFIHLAGAFIQIGLCCIQGLHL